MFEPLDLPLPQIDPDAFVAPGTHIHGEVAIGRFAVIMFGAVIIATSGTAVGSDLLGSNVNFQFTSFVFFTLVLFVWRGSGPLSLDHLIRLDAEKEPEIL